MVVLQLQVLCRSSSILASQSPEPSALPWLSITLALCLHLVVLYRWLRPISRPPEYVSSSYTLAPSFIRSSLVPPYVCSTLASSVYSSVSSIHCHHPTLWSSSSWSSDHLLNLQMPVCASPFRHPSTIS
ncbi:hypothetical protein Q8A67_023497 [Cirrhinus molitorella]|uniref:Uncharacterized protein n=1 Tax=Cirrhinus molitorella TaxID=172907 RepID=A0AA88P007_9TELE|nr:hypothetical protein Q8A67_023497 [Cirrhinus molitorella]